LNSSMVMRGVSAAGAAVSDVAGVGIGAPGTIDTAAGTVSSSPNLPGFQGAEDVPLGAMVAAGLDGAEVKLDNDVRVAILGEWKRGAGRGFRNLLGVWVGTGVGGGLIIDGKLFQGQGAAGEIGHTIVEPGGRVCSDGRKGHLEAYAGRGQMEAEARRRVKKGKKTDLFDIMERKGKTRLASGVWATALEKKDEMARELVDDAVWALATGLASVQNLLSLEAIIVGGGLVGGSLALAGCGTSLTNEPPAVSASGDTHSTTSMQFPIAKTDAEWQKQLTPEQYRVLREKGTEQAFTGEFWNTKAAGTYRCAACGEVLFVSDTKFDSGCGWPSFYQPAGTNVITEASDHSLGMVRTEVMCSKCGGHLGHVFEDGPQPTGLRYCINSLSLKFEQKKEEKK